jgi:hypothetical protein
MSTHPHPTSMAQPSKRPLRIGVLLDGPIVSHFSASVLASVVEKDYTLLALVILNGETLAQAKMPVRTAPLLSRVWKAISDPAQRRKISFRLYQKWDRCNCRNPVIDPTTRLTSPVKSGMPNS